MKNEFTHSASRRSTLTWEKVGKSKSTPGSTGSWKPALFSYRARRPRVSHHSTGRVLPSRLKMVVSDCERAFRLMMGLIGCGPGNTPFTGTPMSFLLYRKMKSSVEFPGSVAPMRALIALASVSSFWN